MKDYIVKATAADNQIRAYAATTKELVEHARNIHNTSPVATKYNLSLSWHGSSHENASYTATNSSPALCINSFTLSIVYAFW